MESFSPDFSIGFDSNRCSFDFLFIGTGYFGSDMGARINAVMNVTTLNDINKNLLDSEPDLFYFNINGSSGKFVFDKDKFNIFRKTLDKATEIIPYKIHDIIQTPQDMVNNLKRQDKIIITAIKDGVILWGHDFIARSIKNVQTQ